MKFRISAAVLAFTIGGAGVAVADETETGNDDAQRETELVRARITGGPDAPAPGLGASVQGGWGGARAQAIGALTAEGLVLGKITLRAGVQVDVGKTRPTASASYEIFDPYSHAVGLLVGVAYKPEGLTEGEGEVEGTVAASRRIGRGIASASITYGQDPDFNEHDGEIALAAVEPVAKGVAFGGVTRARSGLGSSKDLGAKWDGLAGAVARMQVEEMTVTAVAGTEIVGLDQGGTKLGFLGTLSVGAWW